MVCTCLQRINKCVQTSYNNLKTVKWKLEKRKHKTHTSIPIRKPANHDIGDNKILWIHNLHKCVQTF